MSDKTCTRCNAMSFVLAVGVGVLFGVGLMLSGMTQPSKVIGFLDVLGDWDPSLAFVMGGGVAVYAPAYIWIRARRGEPWFDVNFHVPTRRDIDGRLVLGAAIFGIGWGLGGLCPGPAIVSGGSGNVGALVFLPAMLFALTAWRRQ